MKATELRIGNWVYQSEMYGEQQCTSYEVYNFDLYCNGADCVADYYEGWKPIPLTEEWHNKFGVKINGHMSFEYPLPRKNNIKVKIVFSGDYVYLIQGDKTMEQDIVAIWNKDLTKRDMFVHEFQNLVFALTGEELKEKI